jgi:hypothetical protein
MVLSLLPIRTAADTSLVEQQNKSPSNPAVKQSMRCYSIYNIFANVNKNKMEKTKAMPVQFLLNTATV